FSPRAGRRVGIEGASPPGLDSWVRPLTGLRSFSSGRPIRAGPVGNPTSPRAAGGGNASPSLEKLHGALMLLRRGTARKGPEIAPLAGLRILLARIKPANHGRRLLMVRDVVLVKTRRRESVPVKRCAYRYWPRALQNGNPGKTEPR